jgi:hypothetical protein
MQKLAVGFDFIVYGTWIDAVYLATFYQCLLRARNSTSELVLHR